MFVMREGWLEKRPVSRSLTNTWRRRWLTLYADRLEWAEDAGKNLRGVLLLPVGGRAERQGDSIMVIRGADNRRLALRGEDLSQWVQSIDICLSRPVLDIPASVPEHLRPLVTDGHLLGLAPQPSARSYSVRGEPLNRQAALTLAKAGSAGKILLFGTSPDEAEADFSSSTISLTDALLIASDVSISDAMRTVRIDAASSDSTESGALPVRPVALPVRRLKGVEPVTLIDLSGRRVTALSGIVLGWLVESNTALTDLRLESNSLGLPGAVALASVLRVNTTLNRLNIGDNDLGPEGAAVISEALEVNGTLRSLSIDNNRLEATGGRAIAKALATNTALMELNLFDNKIGTAGGDAIAAALPSNAALTSMDISMNKLGEEVCLAIAAAQAAHPTLTECDTRWNGTVDAGEASAQHPSRDRGDDGDDTERSAALSEVTATLSERKSREASSSRSSSKRVSWAARMSWEMDAEADEEGGEKAAPLEPLARVPESRELPMVSSVSGLRVL